MANRTPKTAAPKGNRTAKSPAEIEAEKKRKADERAAALRATKDDDEERSEDDEDERDEDSDEERDGDDAEGGDEDGDGERASDDDADSDDDRDDEDDEGQRAAPRPTRRTAPKVSASPTRAEVRKAAEEAVRADRVRSGEIRELAAKFGLPRLGERHALKGTSFRAFKEVVLEKLGERQAKRGTTTFAAAATAGIGETYGGTAPSARDFDKGAAEARALLGKK